MTKTRSSGASQYKSFGLVLQAMVVLARKGDTCSSCEMAELLSSEATLLRKTMAKLTRAQILVTKEGRDGGYALNCDPEKLTLADIYQALEAGEACSKAVNETMCGNALGEQMMDACGELFAEMDRSIVVVLEKYTLAEMVRKAGC
ncbi:MULTISPECIES: Rrf2 family transcriptional regulator [unclassified Paenibacillus]|uniref:RrF2 family transcriptional regulator n=1 Tax=unclassified Paenibacillus TaxID=185978 RepID=UPI0024070289|nr:MULTISPECIES: Rrf2 family transcriptional regulator [unclassified Paenibacillus]MDF9842432.1 Rrf2 family transcriptional repressor of oqxAB [Paenibacillus sp. PastF-2]MDF9849022.1 Rrf2 family transcriptional repressor of oqxAB [Paenibacillus sp. PastM-2]MDF9855592.1 Rrf2 family transcriptional repressor of oqxAB [Paenibacillus sp. PastF-1]MDH6480864.1 Rrf2 family transcriptional repressor of oqxAB [Paenibacillus sp. PastH-2]MDH6508286.1 Rrf2 family transcriptional repressor of oqxAB [Paenib